MGHFNTFSYIARTSHAAEKRKVRRSRQELGSVKTGTTRPGMHHRHRTKEWKEEKRNRTEKQLKGGTVSGFTESEDSEAESVSS